MFFLNFVPKNKPNYLFSQAQFTAFQQQQQFCFIKPVMHIFMKFDGRATQSNKHYTLIVINTKLMQFFQLAKFPGKFFIELSKSLKIGNIRYQMCFIQEQEIIYNINQQMQNSTKLHYCTDIPIGYRYKKIKSVITALGIEVNEVPRQTFADLRQLSSIPTLPLLQTSEGNFTSSNTIIKYLSAKSGYKLYGGQNLYERALIDQWLDLLTCDFDTCAIAVNIFIEGKQVDIESVTHDAQKFLTHLNKHLKNRNFIVGQSLSIADLAIAATIGPVLAHMYGQEERKKYGILSKWYESIVQVNKEIQPKQLPKKIHKKFDKNKDKNPKNQGTKQLKQQKDKQKANEKKNQKSKQIKQGQKQTKEKKEKKDKKGNQKKQDKKQQKQGKKQEKQDDLFADEDNTTDGKKQNSNKQQKKQPKKQVKKKPAAKSIVVFNVKVFEQEQDLHKLAQKIKTQIQMDGLVWNTEIQIKPIAFGMNMLQIGCVIEDSKVSVEEDIYNKILTWEKQVQSVDTVNFQKL